MYIRRPDLSPAVGWETGRASEPAFLDMNLHALRDGVAPPVVLFQFDKADPMNPLGLLMAYAEAQVTPPLSDPYTSLATLTPTPTLTLTQVTPVVSDFDTFLVGSRGVQYAATPPEQVRRIDSPRP